MEHFSFGLLSIALGAGFPLIYLLQRQLRGFSAWVSRKEGPKERAGVVIILLAVFGLLVGSFAQPAWDKGAECRAEGKSVFSCWLNGK